MVSKDNSDIRFSLSREEDIPAIRSRYGIYSDEIRLVQPSPWRIRDNKISCFGDDCPIECNEKCPVWLNTMGSKYLQIKKYDFAIKAFQGAIAIEPEFIDAHNNLGVAYGMNNQHEKAREAFLVAYKLNPSYDKALNGLIIAERNLGMIEEALQHCDEYDKLPNCDSSHHREAIRELSSRASKSSFVQIATEFLEIGKKYNFITNDGLPHVPELLVPCEDVCKRIMIDINKYGKSHPETNVVKLAMAWSAFAGIGATYHWHINWNSLSKNGIFETLTAERGVFAMDEYVLDCIGKPFTSPAGQKLHSHIINLGECAMFRAAKEGNPTFETIMECAKAMYFYGMVYEMHQLGLH